MEKRMKRNSIFDVLEVKKKKKHEKFEFTEI